MSGAGSGQARIGQPLTASRLDVRDPAWQKKVQSLRRALGAPHNPHLLPPQFLFATLREIGGHVLQWHRGPDLMAAGTRLTALNPAGARHHLVCYHLSPAGQATGLAPAELTRAAAQLFPDAPIHLYAGTQTHTWADPAVLETVDGVMYGPPRVTDADAIRQLQSTIWQADTVYLYPTYLHDPDFGAVRSLVARQHDRVLGFLLDFLHDGPRSTLLPVPTSTSAPGMLESLILGIHPDYRTRHIAFHLKRIQAAQTRALGIDCIQWVVDPLQYPNARLNVGRLGAVSGQFLRDYLPFRNALNQVRASRLRLIWPLHAPHVQQSLQGLHREPLDLDALPEVGVVNEGPDLVRLDLDADWLAVEIPPDWNRLQRTNLSAAQQWRDATDEIFSQYLGMNEGQYLLTHTGYRKDKVYLVAERVRPDILERYQPTLART